MTRILLISRSRELLIRDFSIRDNGDVKKIQDFIRTMESEYGDIERIILSGGAVRIMDKGEEIPLLSDKENADGIRDVSVNYPPKMERKARTAEELTMAARELWDKRIQESLENHI
jgi:hypothetical protein